MAKRWYAVQHGSDFSSDFGSFVKNEAMKMARAMHSEFPGEEIRIALCRVDDDFCEDEIVVFAGERMEA